MTIPRPGLRLQVLLVTALVGLVAVVAGGAAAAWFFAERQLAAEQSRARAIGESLAQSLERILALGLPLAQLHGFDQQCDEALRRHDGLAYTRVLDPDGQVLFRSDRAPSGMGAAPSPGDDLLHLQVHTPVHTADGRVAGQVVVALPRVRLQAERQHHLLLLAAAGAASLAVGLALVHLLLRRVLAAPLQRVVQAVERMQAGDRDTQVSGLAGRRDELGVLADGFNRLTGTVGQRERELVAARDAAEQASRAKSQFLAMMSHELRTPLNAVVGMSELLARSTLNERQRQLVGQLRRSSGLLTGLIDDLLDLAGIEAGRLRVVQQPFRLRDVLAESVERFRDEAARRRLTLDLELDRSLPDNVRGDPLRVQQVLSNLLSNAIKFTEHGGVSVSVAPAVGGLRFTVADTGVGIDPDFMPHVYEPFRQADSSSARRYGGSGLGLGIARALCEAMGGRIGVSSRPGRGTTFWFELPLAEAPPDALPAPPQPSAAAAAPAAALALLVIDDDPASRDLLSQVLGERGHQVALARDGTEGLRRLRERPWDAVLLDWRLPGIDGAGLLAVLRAKEDLSTGTRTPVIVTTADAFDDQLQACLQAGADAALPKPLDVQRLLQVLAQVCGQASGRLPDPAGRR